MKPLKIIADIFPIPSYSTILLMFFFPFFLIKCGDTTLMSLKGTDLITGVSKKELSKKMGDELKKDSILGGFMNENEKEKNNDNYAPLDSEKNLGNNSLNENENIPPSPFVIIAFLMAMVGLVISLIKVLKNKHIYHIVFSLIGFISLLVFYIGFESKLGGLGNNDIGFDAYKMSISYGFGTAFYVALILFIINVAFYGLFQYFHSNNPEMIYGNNKTKGTD